MASRVRWDSVLAVKTLGVEAARGLVSCVRRAGLVTKCEGLVDTGDTGAASGLATTENPQGQLTENTGMEDVQRGQVQSDATGAGAGMSWVKKAASIAGAGAEKEESMAGAGAEKPASMAGAGAEKSSSQAPRLVSLNMGAGAGAKWSKSWSGPRSSVSSPKLGKKRSLPKTSELDIFVWKSCEKG